MNFETWKRLILRAPEGESGAGAADPGTAGGETGDTGSAGGAAGAGDTGATGGTDDTGASGETGQPRWWESKGLTDAQRQNLTALGLTVDDPVQAVAKLTDMEIAAKRRLGKPADQLIDKPGKDQDVAEWLRGHGDLFGIPEAPEGYEVARPEDWPKDAEWNADLEAKAREIGHKHGLTGAALNDMVGLYASEVQRLVASAEEDLAQATAQMQATLQKDWGDQYAARVSQAQQAASVVAEKAGLDNEALAGLAAALKPKIGDAGTIRMFAAIGEMMGDDMAAGLSAGGGGSGLSTTPAEARAELAALRAPGGAYFEATRKGDHAALKELRPKIERLSKTAAG